MRKLNFHPQQENEGRSIVIGKILHSIIEWIIRGIPGGGGQRIRYAYYKRRLGSCGTNVRIEEWVIFQNPENISIGNDVWIFAHSVLTAPGPGEENGVGIKKRVSLPDIDSSSTAPNLKIGNEVQIGLFNILNGIGGLEIGNCVTLSARVSIYSATHIAYDPNDRSVRVGANGMVHSRPVFSNKQQINIGDGAWLGLDVAVICACVGEEAFIHAGSVVVEDVPSNIVCAGNPAKPVRERFQGVGTRTDKPS